MSGPDRRTLAVALKYEAPHAPKVVAAGRGFVGEKIIAAAEAHGVPIEKNPALAEALSTIELDEENPAPFHNRGVTHRQLGMLDESIRDLTEAIRLDPLFADAFYNRQLAYLQRNQTGDHRAAQRDLVRYRQLTQSPGRGGTQELPSTLETQP